MYFYFNTFQQITYFTSGRLLKMTKVQCRAIRIIKDVLTELFYVLFHELI